VLLPLLLLQWNFEIFSDEYHFISCSVYTKWCTPSIRWHRLLTNEHAARNDAGTTYAFDAWLWKASYLQQQPGDRQQLWTVHSKLTIWTTCQHHAVLTIIRLHSIKAPLGLRYIADYNPWICSDDSQACLEMSYQCRIKVDLSSSSTCKIRHSSLYCSISWGQFNSLNLTIV
jgi:hypothetical protein